MKNTQELASTLFSVFCRWHYRSSNDPLLTSLPSLSQLSIMLYSMKTMSALRAEITVQWQPLLQLQDTTLICNVIKHPLRMYVSSRGWAAEMILFILWFLFQSLVKCSLVLVPKVEKKSH